MKVLFAASEVAPFCKTGGLGDVAGALPGELKKLGVDVRVVLPYYAQIPDRFKEQTEFVTAFSVRVGWKEAYCGVRKLDLNGITYYFINNQDYFHRNSLYGEWDDGERFGFFSMAVIEMMEKVDFIPDVIHVNDWQTAMIPVLLVDKYHWLSAYQSIRKVITIHNILFQGVYSPDILSSVFGTGMNIFHEHGVKYYGNVNFLKGGISFSDVVTTVSPSYAGEIQTPSFGEGLDGVLRHNHWKIRGILNGIDVERNNPETDPALAEPFTLENPAGKARNKEALQERLHLPVRSDVPLLASVGRLTSQKGYQLVEERMEELLQTRDVQVVILGTGEPGFEHSFGYFQEKYPDRVRAIIDFDVQLAQLIYGGADLFLMPSAFEPCGLSQLISMRYGTLPLVHETGGLKDTVQPYNEFTGEGTGFSFNGFTGYEFLQTVYRALDVYENRKDDWNKLVHQAMAKDVSWNEPAKEYYRIYESLS